MDTHQIIGRDLNGGRVINTYYDWQVRLYNDRENNKIHAAMLSQYLLTGIIALA